MEELDRTKDRSVWDIYPKGMILPWYTGPVLNNKPFTIPDSMADVWEFCDGKNGRPNLEDGRFLRGHIVENANDTTGGSIDHAHTVVPNGDFQLNQGLNWNTGGGETSKADVGLSQNIPPFLNVRFIIKVV